MNDDQNQAQGQAITPDPNANVETPGTVNEGDQQPAEQPTTETPSENSTEPTSNEGPDETGEKAA